MEAQARRKISPVSLGAHCRQTPPEDFPAACALHDEQSERRFRRRILRERWSSSCARIEQLPLTAEAG